MRFGATLLLVATACSSGPSRVELPLVASVETLIVVKTEGGRPPSATAYARPFIGGLNIEDGPDVEYRALYFDATPAGLGIPTGALRLTEAGDASGIALAPMSAFRATVRDGTATPFVEDGDAPIYVGLQQTGTLAFSVRQWGMAELLGGVEACVEGAPAGACRSSAGDGRITVGGLEPGADAVVRLSSSSIYDTAFMVNTTSPQAELGAAVYAMAPSFPADFAQMFGTTIDPSKGVVDIVAVFGFEQIPVDVEISPASGRSHRNSNGNVIFDVDPGDYTIRISADGRSYCGPSGLGENWTGREGADVRVRVFAGTVTHVQNVICR